VSHLNGAVPSLQDILRRRQQATFVGRDSRLVEFRENLHLAADDPRRRFIVNIYGIAGVGKSFLLQQFRRIAQAEGACCAYVDEDYFDVVEAMSAIAAEFAGQDVPLTEFEAQLATYRQRRRELESDPNAPLGDLITTTTVRAGFALAKSVPVAGAVAEFVDSDAVAVQANRFRAYLVQRFSKKSDIDLLLTPVEVLTRAFVVSVNRVAEERPVVLFFDTFERTAPYLESWLLNLFNGSFGGLSSNVVTTIAGQHALADNRWSPLRSLIAAHPLEPFTEEEARGFLAQRGVVNEQVIEVILPLSGRVPMWLATLADSNPQEPGSIPDPSESAVERFLKWEPDARRRQLARVAALPRRFNRDILLAIVDGSEVDELFDWLCGLPFVSRTGEHWRYHDAVRDPMLRLARITSPQQWRDQHQVHADYFLSEQAATGLDAKERWSDPTWQALALEECYHRLCAAPVSALQRALESAVEASEVSVTLARRWAAMLAEAGSAAGAERLRSWGTRLTELLQDQDDDTTFLTALIDGGALGPESTARAIAGRGRSHRRHQRYEQSLADLDRAVGLQGDDARFHRWRGRTLQALMRFEDALTAFDRAIELDPTSTRSFAQRGVTFRLMDRRAEALADFDRAIELDPDFGWNYGQRGVMYQVAERYEEALADLDRAIELDPEDDLHVAQRGFTLHLMGRRQEAMTDLDRAIEMNADQAWNYVLRGGAFRVLNRHEEALADFNRAIELDPEVGIAFAYRGATHRALERYEEALTDFGRAIELDPEDDWAATLRGRTYRDLGRYEEAIAEFTHAIEISPVEHWDLAERGFTYRMIDRLDDALADLNQAVELNGGNDWNHAQRGITHHTMGHHDAALVDFDRAIELDPEDDWTYARRGMVHRDLERFEEAFADFERAVELNAEETWYLGLRGGTHLSLGRYEAALADFERMLGMDPSSAETLNRRGTANLLLGRYDAALSDYDRAAELEPDDDWNRGNRGRVHQLLGHFEKALTDFSHLVEREPSSSWWRFLKGVTLKSSGRRGEGEAEILTAIDLLRPETAAEPEVFQHRFNLVVYLLGFGRLADARLALRETLDMSPTSVSALEFLEDLQYLAACPGLDVDGIDELSLIVTEYRDARLSPAPE